MFHLGTGPTGRLHALARWSERTQQAGCRNAMVASTELAERRRERDEAAAYVEDLIAHRADAVPAPGPPTARGSALG